MNRYRKNTAAFIFVVIISIPLLFSAFVYLKKISIQHAMRRLLTVESLQTITIPVTAYHWDIGEKEIILEGKMFDIKSIKKVNDNYIITGLFDSAQTNLQHAAQHISLKKSKAEPGLSIYRPAFFSLYPFPQDKETTALFYWKQNKFYNPKQENTPEIHLDISTPPPQQI